MTDDVVLDLEPLREQFLEWRAAITARVLVSHWAPSTYSFDLPPFNRIAELIRMLGQAVSRSSFSCFCSAAEIPLIIIAAIRPEHGAGCAITVGVLISVLQNVHDPHRAE